MSDYDYERYQTIIEKIIRNYSEIEDDYDYLEIGVNVSGIPSVKVIFDGFGLAEELYYEGRTFCLQEDVVMVQNDDYEFEPLDESDDDYDEVKYKLELFDQYANSDGPCNPESQSFAIFIHKDAINDGFEFPEHEFTPWGLAHRTSEEVCIYVWWDRENDTMDVLDLSDRLDKKSPFDEAGVMAILEKIAKDELMDE